MAGIGFELQKVVKEDSYVGAARGYLYAAVISSGPWLLSVVALSLLGLFSFTFLPQEASEQFAATVTHTFAVSLITTGVIQMVVTRYLSDQLYLNNPQALAPTFVAVLTLSSGFQFILINLLLATTTLPLEYRLPATSLYVAVSGTWVAMIFLSAARDYITITLAFATGYLISFVAAISLGARFGLSAYLMGFAAGQVVMLGLLVWRVLAEFELKQSFSIDFLGHFRQYPQLALIGFVYNLALWIDKIVFWVSPVGVDANSFMGVFPVYDAAFFAASLVAVPALALFTTNIETAFYLNYKSFYDGIQFRGSLRELLAAKEGMARSLRRSCLTLLKVQIIVALLAIVFAPVILEAFRFPLNYVQLFRVMVLGMSTQVFLLFTVLILLYLDLRGSVLIIVSVFLVTNLGFTYLTILGGFDYYGLGFLFSSIVSVAVALAFLVERFGKLEYLTFVRQPVDPDQ